jgi:hypothetical protein
MTTTRQLITSAAELRDLIRHLAADEPDPALVTERILSSLSGDEALVVAGVALHDYVRRVASAPTLPQGRSYATADGRSTPSRKVAMIRDWVAAELGRSVCVITGSGKAWKHLGACSAEDLHVLAIERDYKASLVAAEGKRYDRLARAVADAGAATLGDLDRKTLEEVLR